MRRLAAIVPLLQVHLVPYGGGLAPHRPGFPIVTSIVQPLPQPRS